MGILPEIERLKSYDGELSRSKKEDQQYEAEINETNRNINADASLSGLELPKDFGEFIKVNEVNSCELGTSRRGSFRQRVDGNWESTPKYIKKLTQCAG